MNTTDADAASRCLSVLAVVGIASVLALFAEDGLNVDGIPGAARLLGTIMLAVLLAVGLSLKTREPSESMVLLVIGAFAPTAAWYHFAPAYLLTVAIAGLALFTAPHPRRARRVSVSSVGHFHRAGRADPSGHRWN